MLTSLKIISFLMSFALSLESGLSIKCFKCNTANNSACTDMQTYNRPQILDIVECGNKDTPHLNTHFFCRKITQHIILPNGYKPEVRVTRGCGFVPHKNPCYKYDNEDHLETVCQCFEDYCNSAPRPPLSLLVTLATVSAVMIVKAL